MLRFREIENVLAKSGRGTEVGGSERESKQARNEIT